MKQLSIFLLAMVCSVLVTQAQITAYINGKPVKSGSTVTKEDLKSLEISFAKAKKPSFIYGKLSYVVELVNAEGVAESVWYLRKDGSASIEDFLDNTPATKKFKVFSGKDFVLSGNTLDWLYKSLPGQEKAKKMTVQINLLYREQTGYQEYAQHIELLPPVTLDLPLWDEKNLYLNFLDLSIDKTGIAGDLDMRQSGRMDSENTIWGYRTQRKNDNAYRMYALSSDQFPGLNTKELAEDFIHAAALYAAQGFVTKFANYDIAKYTIDWDEINDLLSDRRRIPSLSWKINKEIKKMDLMTLLEPVEINGLKGYKYKADVESRTSNSDPWKSNGKFVIYILNHPTNPKLTLVVSNTLYNNATNVNEVEDYIKKMINSIKK